MTKTLITVCVPIYNAEEYLERCLQSLFSQTMALNTEFILIDDCSTDNSYEIVKLLANQYKNLDIKIYHNERNLGSAETRNIAIRNGVGEYLICVDSDDWCECDYLEKLYSAAMLENADIVGCNLIVELGDSQSYPNCKLETDRWKCIENLLEGKIQGWLPIKLVNFKLIKEKNIFFEKDLNICEDLLFVLKLLFYTDKLYYLDENLYHYNRQNSFSQTFRVKEADVSRIISVDTRIIQLFQDNGYFECYRDSLLMHLAFNKLWICFCSEKIRKENFDIYAEYKLSGLKKNEMKKRVFLLLCDKKIYILSYLMIILKRLKNII